MKPRLLVSLIPSIHVYQASFAIILMHRSKASSFHQYSWNKHLYKEGSLIRCGYITHDLFCHLGNALRS